MYNTNVLAERRLLVVTLALLALGSTACTSFSSAPPPPDETDAGDGVDAGNGDAAEPEDAATAEALANNCNGEMPIFLPNPEPRNLPTSGLSNTLSSFSSCGASMALLGRDGFFQLDSAAGDRWHVMVRPMDEDQDVAVYFLNSCDERACRKVQDRCGPGQPEHANFMATDATSYIIGVESSTDAMVMVMVMRPPCGNGMPNHGETCDDGNRNEQDGCDNSCRVELLSASSTEVEPNNDVIEANVVVLRGVTGEATVTGMLGGPCDSDRFAVQVPEGGSVIATVLGPAGSACGDMTPTLQLALTEPTEGGATLGMGVAGGAGGVYCPSIEAGVSFAAGLSAGEYQIALQADHDAELFGYQLRIQVLDPPP